jgi:hypothetical protein
MEEGEAPRGRQEDWGRVGSEQQPYACKGSHMHGLLVLPLLEFIHLICRQMCKMQANALSNCGRLRGDGPSLGS